MTARSRQVESYPLEHHPFETGPFETGPFETDPFHDHRPALLFAPQPVPAHPVPAPAHPVHSAPIPLHRAEAPGAPASLFTSRFDPAYPAWGPVPDDAVPGYTGPGHPESGYAESGYAESGYAGSGYAESGYAESGYAGSGYAESGYVDAGPSASGYATSGHSTHGYAQPGYAAPGYAEPGYAQPGYAVPGYAEPGYAEPGYAEPGYAEPEGVRPGRVVPEYPISPVAGYPEPGYRADGHHGRLHLVGRVDTRPNGLRLGAPVLLDTQVLYRAEDRTRERGPEPDNLAGHVHRYGERPRMTGALAERFLSDMESVALTGHGGAHFPVARKWRTVLEAGGGGFVVANGAEGEPASAKDAALLQHRTHLVLDGIATAVEVLGATNAVIWLHEGALESLRAVHRAIADRRAAGFGDPPIEIVTAPDHYLSGESSAVVRGLEGSPVLPAFTRMPAARRGVNGVPTLVQNVETLARVALLARTGPDAEQPGQMLTVVGDGVLTVVEVSDRVTLGEAARLASISRPSAPVTPQAVLVGGFGGRWVPWSGAVDLPLADFNGRKAPSLGAGIVALAEHDVCGLTETAAVLAYLADSSARQCGPCLYGTRELADVMARIAAGKPRRGDQRRIASLGEEIRGRGACGMPNGAVALAVSAMEAFAADLDSHLGGRPCAYAGSRTLLPVPGRVVAAAQPW